MPFGFGPNVFIPQPLNNTVIVVVWKDDPELKQQFAIELAKNKGNSFEAACAVFGKETNKALWASINWINDPIVIDTKQNYTEVTEAKSTKLLDKIEFAARLLEAAEEKIEVNGNSLFAFEGKDRIAAYKLYGETMGFINNKTEINNINSTDNRRFMEIKFVEPDKKENTKVIEHEETQEENILDQSPIKLKLVG